MEKFNLEKNDIPIIFIPRKDNNVSCISVFIKVGSVNENESLYGASHFLEHILFKGTKNRPKSIDISKELDSVGAYFNAYTDKDITSFVIKLDSDYLEKAVDIVSDMLLNSLFESKNFELEKRVVVEEINKNLDLPENQTIENLYKIVFKNNPLERSIGATEKSILNYARNDVIDYFKKYYSSNNIFISITSNLDIDVVNQLLNNSHFKNYKKNELTYQLPKLEKQISPRYTVKNKELEQLHIAIGFPVCSRYDDDKYVLDFIRIILSGNMSSRLFLDLRERHGLSYNIAISVDHYDTSGIFYIYTSFDKDSIFIKNQSKVKDEQHLKDILFEKDDVLDFGPGGLPIIIENLIRLKRNPVRKDELDKVKGFLKGNLILSNEDSHVITDYYGKQLMFNSDTILSFEKLIEKYISINAEDILRVSNKYFKYNNLNISVIGNYSQNNIEEFTELYCKDHL